MVMFLQIQVHLINEPAIKQLETAPHKHSLSCYYSTSFHTNILPKTVTKPTGCFVYKVMHYQTLYNTLLHFPPLGFLVSHSFSFPPPCSFEHTPRCDRVGYGLSTDPRCCCVFKLSAFESCRMSQYGKTVWNSSVEKQIKHYGLHSVQCMELSSAGETGRKITSIR